MKFIWNIKNNEKYFKNEISKDKFNELSPKEQGSLKTYYSTYKNSRKEGIEPTQAQIDYEKFLQIEKDNDPIKEFYESCTKGGWVTWLIISIILFIVVLTILIRLVVHMLKYLNGILKLFSDNFFSFYFLHCQW